MEKYTCYDPEGYHVLPRVPSIAVHSMGLIAAYSMVLSWSIIWSSPTRISTSVHFCDTLPSGYLLSALWGRAADFARMDEGLVAYEICMDSARCGCGLFLGVPFSSTGREVFVFIATAAARANLPFNTADGSAAN